MFDRNLTLWKTWAVLTLGTLIGSTDAWALDPALALSQYAHDRWSRRDGIPASVVMAITQTPDGYLWLGTTGGAARFDGHSFSQIPTHPVAPHRVEAVVTLASHPDGSTLMGLRNGGVRRHQNGKVERIDPEVIDPIVRRVHVDQKGVIRAGTVFGLFEIDADFTATKRQTGHTVVTDLAEAADGTIYVGTHRGVHVISPRGESEIQLPGDQNVAEKLLVDRHGTLWIGTYHGLVRWKDGQIKVYGSEDGLIGEHVTALCEDRDGNVWVGTMEGLNRIAGGGEPVFSKRDSMRFNGVLALQEDREGSLWIGTRDGLERMKDVSIVPWTSEEGLLGNFTPSVSGKPDGTVIVFNGGDPTGITLIRDGVISARTDVLDGPSLVRQDGTLWIANTGVLFRVAPEGVRRFGQEHGILNHWITAVGEDREGLIIAYSTMGGLRRFSPENGTTPYVLRDGTEFTVPYHVSRIFRANDGVLWMATYDGIWRVEDGDVTRYTSAEGERAMRPWYSENQLGRNFRTVVDPGIVDNWFTFATESSDGTLWFASHRTGVARFKDGKWASLTSQEGLPSNETYSVLIDGDGSLWGSCARGIFFVSKAELDAYFGGRSSRVSSKLFTDEDGMKTEEAMHEYQPVAWKSPEGILWFATKHGVVSVDPHKLQRNTLIPPVLIERLVVDGKSTPAGLTNDISPGHQKLDIHFTALSLLAPGRVRFRYMLEGYDKDWIEGASPRVAHYTKVGPGEYRFRVLASNNDGLWNEEGASVLITVQPRFYQTLWFLVLCGAVLAALVYAAHLWRVRHLRSRENILQSRVAQRTAELSQANQKLTQEIAEREKAEQEVERVHRRLLTASHQAGMAEVATGVLHNVGNVLNSVNVSTSVISESLNKSKGANLEKVAALISENEKNLAHFFGQDPKGTRLPQYLRELSMQLAAERGQLQQEVKDLQSNIDHIKDIVTMQQSYARVSGVSEPINPADLFDDALLINASALARHEIEVKKEIARDLEPMIAEKHKVLQILVNLINNAKLACQESGRKDKRITLGVHRTEGRVEFVVTDNGVGIPQENLVKIFNHGFTTRKDGHGFGLHSGALAATEMGGSLTVRSDGPQKGATFVLSLPFRPALRR